MKMRNTKKRPLGIYLHIPFCARKCNYCDFLSAPASAQVQAEYARRLEEEIRGFENAGEYEVVSVFFGGGTPSLLPREAIVRLMNALRETFAFRGDVAGVREVAPAREAESAAGLGDTTGIRQVGRAREAESAAGPRDAADARPAVEITVECNPGTLTEEKLRAYRACGVNRLSIGLQSASDAELKELGRIHTWEAFERNYRLARELGFANINVDLMSALPGQTLSSWHETLRRVLALCPEHISAYSLIIEEGTPFYEWYGNQTNGHPPLPSEEVERQMYYDTERILGEAGLRRYEISNYARPGYESVHNCGYWLRREYVGFGLGASSQLGRLRYKNTDALEDYLSGDFSKQEVQVLSRDDEIEETMYLGLRLMEGVDLRKFCETFGVAAETIYQKELSRLERQGLLLRENGFLRLTPLGIDVSNQVLAEFLL